MRKLVLAVLLVLMPSLVEAATYYVTTTGTNAWPGCTSGAPCLTIDYVADRVSPGDTVRVADGIYSERLTPLQSGSDGSPITFVADGTVTFCGVTLGGNSYLRFVGFVLDGNAGSCGSQANLISVTSTSSYIEFWHNTIRDGASSGMATSWSLSGHAYLHSSIFVGNVWTTFGATEDNIVYAQGNHNLFAYNEWAYKTCDVANVEGTTYNRWINNYAHDLTSNTGCHTDYWQAGSSNDGLSYNLYDANVQIGGAMTQEHTTNFSNTSPERCTGGVCGSMTQNIFRGNIFHNVGNGSIGMNQMSVAAITHTRFYHNTQVDLQRYAAEGGTNRYGIYIYGTNPPGAWIYNNIEYEAWGASVTNAGVYYVEGSLGINYNLGYDPNGSQSWTSPWTSQANPQSNVNPNFVSVETDDFHLGAGSGDGVAARGTAGPLTTTSGSGTGTTFNVATGGGGFFVGSNATNLPQYSGGLVPGDTITVGTDVLTVASVSGDAITVTSSFTWASGEGVYYGSDTTPDIGALPYKAGGYTLSATYAAAGGTTTITPNDASLVRWVACFSDGVPYAVDNTSPYTCATPSGTFLARAYPRYASATSEPWVAATSGGTAPAPPTNVRIR